MKQQIEAHRDAKETLMYDAHWKECICETLRSIYDDIHDYPDKKLKSSITKKLVQAMEMASKISERFAYYNQKYGEMETGHRGKSLKLIPNYQQTKQRRRARRMEKSS